jgi:uncharacterized membrane protein
MLAFAIFFEKQIEPKYYWMIDFAIAIALLFQYSLTSPFIQGSARAN